MFEGDTYGEVVGAARRAEKAWMDAQRVRDDTPCRYCGGDVLRANYSHEGACHVNGSLSPDSPPKDVNA